jgi:hypothetical protein
VAHFLEWKWQRIGLVQREEAWDQFIPFVGDLARIGREHPDADARWNALELVQEMGYRALPAIDALIGALRDEVPAVRAQALRVIGEVASPRIGGVNLERWMLEEGKLTEEERSAVLRWHPLDPERQFGEPYVKARDKALAAVAETFRRDPSPSVQSAALYGLEAWGPHAAHLAEEVVTYLRHADPDVASSAVPALRGMKPPPALVVKPLMAYIQSIDRSQPRGPNRARGAIALMGKQGAAAAEALDLLRGLESDPKLQDVVREAIAAIQAGPAPASK